MKVHHPLVEIGVALYPDVALATVHGLTDMFAVATTLAKERMGANAPILRVSHWRPNGSNDAVECISDTHPEFESRPVAVIVPGSWKGLPSSEVMQCLVQWLLEHHRAGATLCSVCGGAFMLAETGLLAGRSATTHWSFTAKLSESFPDIQVDENRITVEDGNLITAGGVLAWTDLGLKLVDRYLGSTIMIETARFMLVDPPGREQRYYSNFAPKLQHSDAAVLKVQHWLQNHASNTPSVKEMAQLSGLEERTFLRRFHKATGLRPTEYCQRLRVGKAREMLEFTNKTIEQIGWAIGYQDSGSFRKVFRRVVGLSPGEYRRRFAVALHNGGQDVRLSEPSVPGNGQVAKVR
jgi:transcriptional regulator GlxA family with amidase domain